MKEEGHNNENIKRKYKLKIKKINNIFCVEKTKNFEVCGFKDVCHSAVTKKQIIKRKKMSDLNDPREIALKYLNDKKVLQLFEVK